MATLYAKTAGGLWSSANTWSNVSAGGVDNSGPPTAADNVIFEALSGNVTIDTSAAVCRSLDCTSGTGTYAGTLTHTVGIILTIGDGTAGAGNVALKLTAGMTYTLGGANSTITFSSTSATQQTITTAGKTIGNTSFAGVGSSYLLSDAFTSNAASLMSLGNGTLNTNGQTVSLGSFTASGSSARTLTMGASAITVSGTGSAIWTAVTSTNLTVTANTATVTLTGVNAGFSGGGINWNGLSVVITGSGVLHQRRHGHHQRSSGPSWGWEGVSGG